MNSAVKPALLQPGEPTVLPLASPRPPSPAPQLLPLFLRVAPGVERPGGREGDGGDLWRVTAPFCKRKTVSRALPIWGSPAGLCLHPNRWAPICTERQRAHLLPQHGSESNSLPPGVPCFCTHVLTLVDGSLLRVSVARRSAGRGREQRAHDGCSTWLCTEGLAEGSGLTGKGGEALQSPAPGHRGRRRRRASRHPAAREEPGCRHTTDSPRRSSGPAGAHGPAQHRQGSCG